MSKVVIVEDDLMIADIAEEVLVEAGYEVCGIARTVEDGVALARRHSPDLALIDLLLPGPGSASGLRTVQIIRQAISPQQLHIIVVSACSQKELEQAQAELPQVPILRKPFKMRQLLELIDQMQPAG